MSAPSSVAKVVARMESTVSTLPPSDGVACFTRLYLAVTAGVQERLARLVFADPRFLAQLDVAFADLILLRARGGDKRPVADAACVGAAR